LKKWSRRRVGGLQEVVASGGSTKVVKNAFWNFADGFKTKQLSMGTVQEEVSL